MKFLLAVAGIVVVIVVMVTSKSLFSDSNTPTATTTTTGVVTTTAISENYKKIGDDKDDVVETNNQIMLTMAAFKKELDAIKKRQEQQNIPQNTTQPPDNSPTTLDENNFDITTIKSAATNIKNRGTEVVNALAEKVNFISEDNDNTYTIGGASRTTGKTRNQNVQGTYIWKNSILSQESVTKNQQAQSTLTENNINDKNNTIPRFTIPGITTFETTNLTALIGRIPGADNKINEPYRFSLKVTNTGLFANNHEHNKLDSMLVSGIATGDLLLSCVNGSIDTVVYIFSDGTISQTNEPDLAVITDDHGNCINGKLVTDFPKVVSLSASAAGLAGYSQAIIDEQKTNIETTNPDGSTSTSSQITGDLAKVYGYSALNNIAQETNNWIKERAQSSFDAIVVPSGQTIQIHFNKMVKIDYDPNGRKLIHKQQHKGGNNEILD